MAYYSQPENNIVRVPLVGIYNTREPDANEDPSAGIVGIGVVGTMVVGSSSQATVKDQRFYNCIPTKLSNTLTSNESFYLFKRPGFVEHSEPATGDTGKEIMVWGGKTSGVSIVSAFEDTNSDIYVDTTQIGSITGECIFLYELKIGTTPAFVIMSDDNTLWYYAEDMISTFTGDTNTNTTIDSISDTSGLYVGQAITGTDIPVNTRITSIDSGTQITISNAATGTSAGVTFTTETIAKVTDTDYPGNNSKTVLASAVFLNGFLFVMDSDGVIYNSDLNSLVSWSANTALQTQQYPDKGVGLKRFKNLIVGFNTRSAEFFADVGTETGTPLLNNAQLTIKVGAVNAKGITEIDDILAWVSSSAQGGSGIYLYDNYNQRKISTPPIDQKIGYYGASSASLHSIKYLGRTFIILNLNRVYTFVYCIEDDIWHEWGSTYIYWDSVFVDYTGTNIIYAISTGTDAAVVGKVWRIAPTAIVYQDDSNNYEAFVQTSKLDFDNKYRKRLNRFKLNGTTIINTSGNIEISWSDDDYHTFTVARTVAITDVEKVLRNLGTFRERAFKISYTGAAGFKWENIELEYTQGIN